MVKYLVFSFMVIFSSCLKDDELILVKEQNRSGSLKMNGYFISKSFTLDVYFLYENGIIFNPFSFNLEDSTRIDNILKNSVEINTARKLKYSWGVYKIENQKISIERWYPGDKPYDAFLETGEILNDSTFRITTFSEPDGSEPEIRNEIYKFRKFTPKPDSTNVFIK